ncbi:MAG: hypothetical protein ABIK86_01425 [candidate division WOR-3 bacterium]
MFAADIPAARRAEIISGIARRTVELRLTPIAVVMLEASKPLSFVSSQLLIFFQPIVTAVFPFHMYDEVAALLEDRAAIESLIQAIEKLEEERHDGKGKDNSHTCD